MNLLKVLAAGTALLALAACEMPPEGISEDGRAFFDEAVTSINCRIVDEGDIAAVMFQTGLSREQVLELMGFRVRSEDMVPLEGGGYLLVTGECAQNA